jgi:hypothetical protein
VNLYLLISLLTHFMDMIMKIKFHEYKHEQIHIDAHLTEILIET